MKNNYKLPQEQLDKIQGGELFAVKCPNCGGIDWLPINKDGEPNWYQCQTCGVKCKITGNVVYMP